MKQSDWDVIIVGAGPTGGRTATHLASLGHRVLMLEEHTEIGRPFQCAALVTPKALHEVVFTTPFSKKLTVHEFTAQVVLSFL